MTMQRNKNGETVHWRGELRDGEMTGVISVRPPRGETQDFKLTITPMKVITKDNVDEATPWEPTDASTQATLDLDLTTLHHDFATEAGY